MSSEIFCKNVNNFEVKSYKFKFTRLDDSLFCFLSAFSLPTLIELLQTFSARRCLEGKTQAQWVQLSKTFLIIFYANIPEKKKNSCLYIFLSSFRFSSCAHRQRNEMKTPENPRIFQFHE